MQPKPKGWSAEYAAWFDEASVASRYHLRPPYPAETFSVLASLAASSPRAVLDAGCGTGDLARGLAPLVERVDAVDSSQAMLAAALTLPGADAPNLHWVHAPIETAPLVAPYALVVAGDSVHWFEWERAMRLFVDALSPGGVLALVTREWLSDPALTAQLVEVYARHGANPDFAPLSPVEELERRGLFERRGEHRTESVPWAPTLDELIGCHHSQNGFVIERMRDAAAFDRELTAALDEAAPARDGRFQLDVSTTIVWGRPRRLGE
jgi:SAM-dependent methyltransferase